MGTLVQTLHVLAAVLVVGPLAFAPALGRRCIRQRDARGVRAVARRMSWFGAGSVAVAGLGALTVLASEAYDFADPWIVIALTLYAIVLGLIYLFAVPALHTAARLLDDGVLTEPTTTPAPADSGEPGPAPTLRATAEDLHAKERLDATTGRIVLAGVLILAIFSVITVLMVVRPFGG